MIQLSELPRSSCSKYPFMFKLFAKFLVLKVSEVRLQAGNRANTLPSLLQIFLNNEPVKKAGRWAGSGGRCGQRGPGSRRCISSSWERTATTNVISSCRKYYWPRLTIIVFPPGHLVKLFVEKVFC